MTLLELIHNTTQQGFEISFRARIRDVSIVVSKDGASVEYAVNMREAAVNDDQGLLLNVIDRACRQINLHFAEGSTSK